MRSIPSQRHEYLLLPRLNDEALHSSVVLGHFLDTSIERWLSGVCSCDARRLLRNEHMLATSFVVSFPSKEPRLHSVGERWCNFSCFFVASFDDESGWSPLVLNRGSTFAIFRPTVFGSFSPICALGIAVEPLALFFSR